MTHSAPHMEKPKGTVAAIKKLLGKDLVSVDEANGELALHVKRDALVGVLTQLRDECGYQQLMEIAGVDWPDRDPRFEIVYFLLSLTKNHRIRVHVTTSEDVAVPSVTGIWPVAGWLEREVFDMYGVLFSGNEDLRRILTDYGFTGHPQRKDFPLTGYVELRYSEEEKRVKYEPVQLAQDFRSFDFLSPWEGADYVLPGDEKVIKSNEPPRGTPPQVNDPKTTDKPSQTGAGAAANVEAKKRTVRKPKAVKE
ncbi:NADH-quinone oxidoreductase subunit C [Sphingorhabdus profundilacus]